MDKISIRNAKFAKIGLRDLINYINDHSEIKTKDMIMAEIGSYVGDSTEIFAQNFKKVYSIDPYLNGYDDTDPSSYNIPMEIIEAQFIELCKQYSNIEKVKKMSEEGAKLFKDSFFDFVYIDGNHKYEAVKIDIACWLPKLKTPGFFGGHDYSYKWAQGVKPAVDETLGIPDQRFRETSWIKYIKNS